MKELIRPNEVRLYPNNLRRKDSYFNVHARNDWFSKEFVYKVTDEKVVFKRPSIDTRKIPTRSRRAGNGWAFYLTLPDQGNRRLEIHDEDINEDQAILYR